MSSTVICPMCRSTLDPDAQARACQHCPLHHLHEGCTLQMIRCPVCGYHSLATEVETVDETGVEMEVPVGADDVGAAPAATASSRRLDELLDTNDGVVTGFNDISERAMRRLMAYGVVPGARFKLLQRRPAYILQVGQTELALESEIAASVCVDAAPGGEPS